MEPGAAGRQWVPFLLLAPAIRGAAQAHLSPPENADRPVGRALSHRLFSDRPGRRRQSRAEGQLGQAAAERRAAICRDGGLPALVAAERRQQAELLLCVGRGERSLLDGGAGDASKRNCCFLSGEASEAFWTVAPATLAPPRRRHLRHGGWLLARRVRTAFRQRYRLRRFDHYRRRVCPLPPPARSRQA